MKLDRNADDDAVYMQIVEMVKRDIVKGKISPGTKIISIEKFAKHLKVAPNTVAMAYTKLVKEGLLVAKKGVGFSVTNDKSIIENERQKLINQYSQRFAEALKECLPETFTQQGQRISKEEVTKILNKVQTIILSQ